MTNPKCPAREVDDGGETEGEIEHAGENTAFPNVTFGPHEEGHTYQAQALGPFYAPAYLLGGGFSGLEGNVFEKAAQRYGGGRGSWWPWRD